MSRALPARAASAPAALAVPLVLTVAGGALLPAQFATNSALARYLDSVTLAGATSYLVGAAFLLALVRAGGTRPDWAAARTAPKWVWLGGVVGSAYVVGSVLL
ncbi:MAG TPA: DMT family transporter, partial [Deinococcales bacterium]|nr:DMT family transporter [Deinococcales bacterium]